MLSSQTTPSLLVWSHSDYLNDSKCKRDLRLQVPMRSETQTHTLMFNCGLGVKKSALNDMHRHCPIYHMPFKVYLSCCFEWCLFSPLTCFPVWKQLSDLPLSGIHSAFPFLWYMFRLPFLWCMFRLCFVWYTITLPFVWYTFRLPFIWCMFVCMVYMLAFYISLLRSHFPSILLHSFVHILVIWSIKKSEMRLPGHPGDWHY